MEKKKSPVLATVKAETIPESIHRFDAFSTDMGKPTLVHVESGADKQQKYWKENKETYIFWFQNVLKSNSNKNEMVQAEEAKGRKETELRT